MAGRSFFLLSGEVPELSAAELRHVLTIFNSAEGFELLDQRIASASIPENLHEEIIMRTAYTKMSGLLIGYGMYDSLIRGDVIFTRGWERLVPENVKKIRAEVVKIEGAKVNSLQMEKHLSDIILSSIPELKVDLENPELVFTLIASPKVYAVGILKAAKPKKYFQSRRAGKKPFRIPSALQPKIARCLVNLAVPKKDARILDPFAGSGAILVEAGLMGHEAIGLELKTWISNGMALNIRSYCPSICHVVQGDAKRIPFVKAFDSVATDPPYGRSATLAGYTLKGLLKKFFGSVRDVLREWARMAIIIPKEEYENLLAAAEEFKLIYHFDVYVHRSLTRRIAVLKLE